MSFPNKKGYRALSATLENGSSPEGLAIIPTINGRLGQYPKRLNRRGSITLDKIAQLFKMLAQLNPSSDRRKRFHLNGCCFRGGRGKTDGRSLGTGYLGPATWDRLLGAGYLGPAIWGRLFGGRLFGGLSLAHRLDQFEQPLARCGVGNAVVPAHKFQGFAARKAVVVVGRSFRFR